MRENRLVGILSRANLLQALVSAASADEPAAKDDRTIRARLLAELQNKVWCPSNILVTNGVVHLWGQVLSDSEREAMRIAAENIPGVRAVRDHTWYPDVSPRL
jgi:hypothetical protein